MEVRAGYKQTEVGVIPEEWEADNLGRFWGVTDCKHVTAQFVPQGFPLASIREVQSRFVDLTNAKQTTTHFYNLLIEGWRKPRPGDLILSRNATVGEVAQVAEWHPPFAMGQDVCLLRKKSSEHSTEFLQSIFQSPVILKQLADLMVGSTFKRANVQQIRNFAVPMPPAPEQRAIAEALSDVDGLLGGLDRLIAKKRDLKQAAMQQLLTGQTRLPGFHGEWEVKRLGELANIRMCKRIFAEQTYASGDIPFFKIGTFGKEPDAFITKPLYEEYRNKYSFPDNGDILLSAAGTLGRTVIYDGQPGYFQDSNIVWLEINKTLLCNEYLNYCYQVIAWASPEGSTIPRLYNGIIRDSALSLPPLPEQTAIAEVLTEMDAELAALTQRREKTRALKQAMMQELLTGRTRLL